MRAWWLACLLLVACEATQNVGSNQGASAGPDGGVADAGTNPCDDAGIDEATCRSLLCLGTCGGCCMGAVCLSGTADDACGAAGRACGVCPSLQSCSNHICTPLCSVFNCISGCCQNGQCLAGTTDQACGDNGNACASCGSGQHCDSFTQHCQ